VVKQRQQAEIDRTGRLVLSGADERLVIDHCKWPSFANRSGNNAQVVPPGESG
jgi:hypothetical protein